MSRLMTGILLVALLGLTISMAWAQRVSTGADGSDESAYVAGDPPSYDPANPNGFPVAAEATFKATVLNYGQISITPPADLTVPGDSAGVAGEDSIAWDDVTDAGLIAVQANTTCTMAVEVSELKSALGEEIWTEVQLGVLKCKDFLDWMPAPDQPINSLQWVRISSADAGWYDFGQANVSMGSGGTVILSRSLNPVTEVARYWQLPFGVKAKNRTFDPVEGRDAGYNTLALADTYTATMWVTLTKP